MPLKYFRIIRRGVVAGIVKVVLQIAYNSGVQRLYSFKTPESALRLNGLNHQAA